MAQDISGFGLVVTVRASRTFPIGLPVTDFADDADPLNIPDVTLAESSMGLNGDLVTFSKASPIEIELAVIPNSDSDIGLSALVEANRVAKGKASARDVITLIGVYPDGAVKRYTNGRIMSGPVGNSVQSAGRIKSKVYKFAFENKGGI